MSDTPETPPVCEMRRLDDGSVIIVCARQARRRGLPRCVRCKAPAGLLCDGPADPLLGKWPDEEGKNRCSMPLCQAHAFTDAESGLHFCWHHRGLLEKPK